MRTRVTGEARERLRQLLTLRGKALGLTPPSIELLVGAAVLERWPAGEEIVTAEMLGGERVAFVVCGAAKVVCETPRGKRIGVGFVPPGRFVGTGWASEDHARDDFRIIAHDPLGTIVALWTPRAIVDVLATSTPQHALQFVSAGWRTATDVLRQKCHLLGSCLRERVLAVLTTPAHDFGRPHPDGLRIELRVTHNDLAGAAVGSRANVTRALEELRADGLVLVDDHRLVVTHRGLAGVPAEPPRGWPDRIAVGAH